jgi:peptidoglycan hydrolase CwlO-like protein
MTQVVEENVVLEELHSQAYELKVENELIGHELIKCDLIQENDVKITALISDLQTTAKKYMSKIKSRRKKMESCRRKTKKLCMELRESRTIVRRSKLRRATSMPPHVLSNRQQQPDKHQSIRALLL